MICAVGLAIRMQIDPATVVGRFSSNMSGKEYIPYCDGIYWFLFVLTNPGKYKNNIRQDTNKGDCQNFIVQMDDYNKKIGFCGNELNFVRDLMTFLF